MREMLCAKCNERIYYEARDTHWLSLERKGFWPEWSDARCGENGFHSPQPREAPQLNSDLRKN